MKPVALSGLDICVGLNSQGWHPGLVFSRPVGTGDLCGIEFKRVVVFEAVVDGW